jgi:DNA invertase Pin-like site-specific DNA recombinase
MTIQTIIYARSSADCAISADEQVELLRTVAIAQGGAVTQVFIDRAMPRKRGREQRRGEAALLSAIRSGRVNKVLLSSLDRIGQSLPKLIDFLETCREIGVELYLHDRGIDTGMSNGLSLFEVASMMADHLRQARRDRILRGQAEARAASVRFGRPPIAISKVEKARRELANGKGVRQVARLTGISAASASRIKSSMSAAVTA